MTPREPSAMVALQTAVWERTGIRLSDESANHALAAVLDHLPCEAMTDAMRAWDDTGPKDPGYERLVDAAIAAVRRAALSDCSDEAGAREGGR